MKKLMFIGMLCLSIVLLGAFSAGAKELVRYAQGVTLPNAPDYRWWYGCSPTSAGMMMGYYDISGYGGFLYGNLVPGGTAELSTYPYPNPNWDALAKNVIASQGHVTDFYRSGYLGSGDDLPAPWHSFDSLADFMGTSQDSVGSVNGSTWFWSWNDGSKFTAQDAFNQGVWDADGMYGIGEYLQYAGYGATQLYTQRTDNLGLPYGFTFADYMAEIDAGRVVMIQVEGHSMFGYGYDANSNLVYLHDTWSLGQHQMTWGGSYSGMNQWGVVVMELTGGETPAVPEPATMFLLGAGMLALATFRKWFKG